MTSVTDRPKRKVTKHHKRGVFIADPIEDKNDIYVILYNAKTFNYNSFFEAYLSTYLSNLEKAGLIFRRIPYSQNSDFIFIVIEASSEVCIQEAHNFRIELDFENYNYVPPYKNPIRFLQNSLNYPRPDDVILRRARIPVPVNEKPKPTYILPTEKIMIVNKLLMESYFGGSRYEFGIEKLITHGIVLDHYPLHDGHWRWKESGYLGDRQVPYPFLSTMEKNILKPPPVSIIYRYFGPEVAFYFSWIYHCTVMLIPASILSLFVLLYGLIISNSSRQHKINDVCSSSLILCPRCDFRVCQFERLSSYCSFARFAQVSENNVTVAFVGAMVFWITLISVLWYRQECIYEFQWNARKIEMDLSMRESYREQKGKHYLNPITEEMEPIVPFYKYFFRYTFSLITIILLMLCIFIIIFGTMLLRFHLSKEMVSSVQDLTETNSRSLASLTGAVISAISIVIFERCYNALARWITDLENPRTQKGYDNAYILKIFIMAFINNYSSIFYIAFFRGKFSTTPTNRTSSVLNDMRSDTCTAVGCTLDVTVTFFIIIFFKRFPVILKRFLWPKYIRPFFLRISMRWIMNIKKIDMPSRNSPQWEKELFLVQSDRYFLVDLYIGKLILLGFVIFFIPVIPIGSLLCLIIFAYEYHLDVSYYLKYSRRPVPIKTAGIGIYYQILQAIVFMGISLNALVVSFTTDFVWRNLYMAEYNKTDLDGYMNSTLSAFLVEDFYLMNSLDVPDNLTFTTCYYQSYRYPPESPHKYELTPYYYCGVAYELITFVAFENVAIFCCGLLGRIIPAMPDSVKQAISYEEKMRRELEAKVLTESYYSDQREKIQKMRTYSFLS